MTPYRLEKGSRTSRSNPSVTLTRVDSGLLFTLIAFLGGAWILVLDQILTRTKSTPADMRLMPLAVTHCVIFAYLVLTLIVFFWRGMRGIGYRESEIARGAARLLFGTWPVTLIALVLSFAAAQLEIPRGFNAFIYVFPVVAIAFGLLVLFTARKIKPNHGLPRIRWITEVILFPLFVLMMFQVYLLAMSILFSGVDVKADRETYAGTGDITLLVRPSGYVLNPVIKAIECGGFRKEVNGPGAYVIPLSEVGNADYLEVEYEPQIIRNRRKHYESLWIAKTLSPRMTP